MIQQKLSKSFLKSEKIFIQKRKEYAKYICLHYIKLRNYVYKNNDKYTISYIMYLMHYIKLRNYVDKNNDKYTYSYIIVRLRVSKELETQNDQELHFPTTGKTHIA